MTKVARQSPFRSRHIPGPPTISVTKGIRMVKIGRDLLKSLNDPGLIGFRQRGADRPVGRIPLPEAGRKLLASALG